MLPVCASFTLVSLHERFFELTLWRFLLPSMLPVCASFSLVSFHERFLDLTLWRFLPAPMLLACVPPTFFWCPPMCAWVFCLHYRRFLALTCLPDGVSCDFFRHSAKQKFIECLVCGGKGGELKKFPAIAITSPRHFIMFRGSKGRHFIWFLGVCEPLKFSELIQGDVHVCVQVAIPQWSAYVLGEALEVFVLVWARRTNCWGWILLILIGFCSCPELEFLHYLWLWFWKSY